MLELVVIGQFIDLESVCGKLLQIVVYLFCSKGYECIMVCDLVSVVGIQLGSIFYYFKSKDEILCLVMEEIIFYNIVLMCVVLVDVEDLCEWVLGLICCEL